MLGDISEFDDAVDQLKLKRRYDREPLDPADRRFGRPDPFAELEREERRPPYGLFAIMLLYGIALTVLG